MARPLVSVVITTKNEEKNIERCIKSVLLQSWPEREVIVVDNQSADKTKELSRRYTQSVFDKGPERCAQRNFGMLEKSRGEYVMFVDADMVLSRRLLESCVGLMEARGQSVNALHITEIVLGRKYLSKVRRFERGFYDGTVIDGARLFRKDAFARIGGFDVELVGADDWDVDKKLKRAGEIALLPVSFGADDANENPGAVAEWDSEFGPFLRERGVDPARYRNAIYHNESEFDLKAYLSKKGYYAKSFDLYIGKWGRSDPDIRKQFGFFYRYFGAFFEKGKWLRLLSHPLLAFGVYFLRFLVGLKFLFRRK